MVYLQKEVLDFFLVRIRSGRGLDFFAICVPMSVLESWYRQKIGLGIQESTEVLETLVHALADSLH